MNASYYQGLLSSLYAQQANAQRRVEQAASQLEAAKNTLAGLQNDKGLGDSSVESIQENLAEEKQAFSQLKKQSLALSQQLTAVQKEEAKFKWQYQLGGLGPLREQKIQKLHQLSQQISMVEASIRLPGPKPRMKTDGLYCENGIYMCENHPPRKVIINKKEIALYEEKLEKLRLQLQQLQEQHSQVQQEYNEIDAKLNELKAQYEAAKANSEEIKQQLDTLRLQIDEKNRSSSQLARELYRLETSDVSLNIQLIQAQKHVFNCESKVNFAQRNLLKIENQIHEVEARLAEAASLPNYSDEELQEIAHRELEQERVAAAQNSRSSNLSHRSYEDDTEEELPQRLSVMGLTHEGKTLAGKAAARAWQAVSQKTQEVSQEANTEWNRLRNKARQASEKANTVFSTVSSLGTSWGIAGLATSVIMNQARAVVDLEPEPTDNALIDNAYRQHKP